jgi:glycosyltransferase involved in cell wall biosynthesis
MARTRDIVSTGVERPRFSIVIAVLNGARALGPCLTSVAQQTFRDHEVVVMDGGSTDGTQQVIQRFGELVSYQESKPDRGISHAWNKAIPHAHGEWVLFFGADDVLADSDVLKRASGALNARSASVAYGRVALLDLSGQVSTTLGEPWSETSEAFRYRNTIPHQGVFHRRDLFDRNGLFDERFRICADYDLLMREVLRNEPLFLDFTIARMGYGGLSNRASSGLRATREFEWARRKNGLTKTPDWFSPRVWRAAVYELLRRFFGQRVARSVADAYKAVTPRH